MSKVSFENFRKELIEWVKADPSKREKYLTDNTPIADSTLKQTLSGRYTPSGAMTRALRSTMAEYGAGSSEHGGKKATVA
jgi:hypothetical protein